MAPAQQQAQRSPDVLFAFWTSANQEFQKRHFGIVALDHQELAEYCLWRRGLPEQEAQQWDGFVAGLKAGSDLIEKLTAFRFVGEPVDQPSRADKVETR